MSRTWIALLLIILVIGGAWYLNNQNRVLATNYRDGTYEGKSEVDDRDQYGSITVEITDSEIVAAEYTEYDSDGDPKGEEYPYQEAIEAIPDFEARLIESQHPDRVDNISGATTTWEKFKDAANDALTKAEG